MAGAGYKLFASGDVLTASQVNNYLNEQTIMVFSSTSARDTALNSVKSEGMFAYVTGTGLFYYNGSSWLATSLTADITGVGTASTSGLSGGATSGDVDLVIAPNQATSATPTTSDITLFGDADDSNAVKKATLNDLPISSATQTALDAITAGTTAIRTDIAVTVADNGSGSQNEYFLEGAQDQVINLTTGYKYRFDQSNGSNATHPLRFSVTKDGTHASGSEYTDNVTTNGTPGSAGAYTQIEVKADTPERLFIYCTAHAGMGGDTSLTAGAFSVDGGTIRGATDLNDNELSKVLFKDYAETDVAVSSATTLAIDLSAGNTGAVTLAHSVTDVDFTNVPTNGTSSFTLKVTQDGTGSRTMAINAITVNGGGNVTGLTPGAGGLTLSTGANDVDVVTFLFFDAGTPLINALLDFS